MDKQNPIDTVQQDSHTMKNFLIDSLIYTNILLDEYRPEIIVGFLKKFTQENCKVTIVDKIFKNVVDQYKKWYCTKYTDAEIEESVLQ
ncbi:metalloprotease-like protein [Leptotrombidium deliense]|uniref:Metalloprotease-like protein n=1 Tax=Leptotrombidium deliense TaxID=299467 RepID=A0A443S4Q8_9ACAR|nr:metalloprotease-like protein [Leptotrombidium deliense]